MARQNLFLGSTANDGTGDSLRQTGQKINENFIELYQALGNDSDIISGKLSFDSASVVFGGGAGDTFLIADTQTADNTIRLPDASGRILLDTDSDTVSNKIHLASFYVDPQIQDSENSTVSYTIKSGAIAGNRNINLPVLTDSDTFVFVSHTQTLENKTLDSATLNNPTLVGMVEDANGANLLEVTATSSAQNYFTKANAATGTGPTLAVAGVDSDVTLNINSKNQGAVRVSKFARQMVTVTANGNVPKTSSFIDCNKGSALALTLADGDVAGEDKVFANRGAGTATITPSNFAQGTSFAITQNGACSVIWNGSNWFLYSRDSDYVTIT